MPVTRIALRFLVVVCWLALAGVGVVGVYLRLTTGHQYASYGNHIPWGLWVALYIYFAGLSVGSFVLATVVYVARVKLLAPLAPMALFTAVVTLIMALLSIVMDLGHMNRVFEVMLHANLRSMMAWMIFLYSTYFAVLVIENGLALVPLLHPWRKRRGLTGWLARQVARIPEEPAERWLYRLSLVGAPLGTISGSVGALFATIGARPYWHHPLFPILFLIGALTSGCGMLTALYWLVWPERGEAFRTTVRLLGSLTLGLLLFDALLEWAEFSIPLWQGISHEAQIYKDVLFGQFWWSFWILHLFLGTLVPALVLWFGRARPGMVALGGALVAVTFLSVRFNMVIPPMTQPLLEGLPEAFVSQRARFSYFPSSFEWAIGAFVLAVGSGLWAVGMRWLPLLPECPPKESAPEREQAAA